MSEELNEKEVQQQEELQLIILKQNLQTSTSANDELLKKLLKQAKALIERRGIKDDQTDDYQMAVIDYAAFLFRRRGTPDMAMPPHLKSELNNILFSQKMKS